jgi:predicted flap endonuclease-1-like 5' DNA nuclease
MWDQMLKRWIDLLFWWLPSDRTAKEPTPSTGTAGQDGARAPERAVRGAGLAKVKVPDDLTVLKGIGPVVQEKLRSLGITTFRDLAAADPERLTEQLKGKQPISKAQVRAWTQAAREQAGAPD